MIRPVCAMQDLLRWLFWQEHNPARPAYSQQYASLIICHTDQQRQEAEASKARLETRKGTVYTRITSATDFHLAEDYHQKYYLRRIRPAYDELRMRFELLEKFLAEPLVTRLNGYAAGLGSAADLRRDLENSGLSDAARDAFLSFVSRRRPGLNF
jgi:peptide-methionine (S)-S-oxide reductase